MNIFKKILVISILTITNIKYSFASEKDIIKAWLTWSQPSNQDIKVGETNDLSNLDNLFNYFQDSISWLILLIALWVFIYIWIRLVVARWNPEDFKKHIMQFVYAAIWFFIVSAAWALVKLVAWLNF